MTAAKVDALLNIPGGFGHGFAETCRTCVG